MTIFAQMEETAHIILIDTACVLRDGRGHNVRQVGRRWTGNT